MAAKVFESIGKFGLALAVVGGVVNSLCIMWMLDTELSSLTDSVAYRTLWSGKGLISSSLGYRNQLSLTAALDHGTYQSSLVAKVSLACGCIREMWRYTVLSCAFWRHLGYRGYTSPYIRISVLCDVGECL